MLEVAPPPKSLAPNLVTPTVYLAREASINLTKLPQSRRAYRILSLSSRISAGSRFHGAWSFSCKRISPTRLGVTRNISRPFSPKEEAGRAASRSTSSPSTCGASHRKPVVPAPGSTSSSACPSRASTTLDPSGTFFSMRPPSSHALNLDAYEWKLLIQTALTVSDPAKTAFSPAFRPAVFDDPA